MKILPNPNSNPNNGNRSDRRNRRNRPGFMMFEAVLALLVFSVMGIALTRTLDGVRKNSIAIQRNMQLARILDSKLTEVLTLSTLEEGDVIEDNEEIEGQIRTVIEPLELENQEGRALPQMFRIRITALWFEDGRDQEESVEGWRNARLYRP